MAVGFSKALNHDPCVDDRRMLVDYPGSGLVMNNYVSDQSRENANYSLLKQAAGGGGGQWIACCRYQLKAKINN